MKKMLTMLLLLLVFISFGFARMKRPTLIDLCRKSELILVVIPQDTVTIICNQKFREIEATLKIELVIKGDINDQNVQVRYRPDVLCPLSASYPLGDTMIAFLYKTESDEFYDTYGRSYGAKTLNGDSLNVYIDIISELLGLFEVKGNQKKIDEFTKWLVECIENPITRFDAAQLARIKAYELDESMSKGRKVFDLLTTKQKTEIYAAILNTDKIGFSELQLLELLPEFHDSHILPGLIDYLKRTKHLRMHMTPLAIEIISNIGKIEDGFTLAENYRAEFEHCTENYGFEAIVDEFLASVNYR
jgi:hypothetical protein